MIEQQTVLWIPEYVTDQDIYLHSAERILFQAQTEYQRALIVETKTLGKSLILDGKWQSSTADEFLYHEPLVHPAFVMHGNPKRALIIGGGEGATAREALRWRSIEQIDMVDIDGMVVDACREHLFEMHSGAFDDKRTSLCIGDAWQYLSVSSASWDIVISDLTDPTVSGPSARLFDASFFTMIRSRLTPGGLLVLQTGPMGLISETNVYQHVMAELRGVFPYVLPYFTCLTTLPAPWGFAIASSQPLERHPDPQHVDECIKRSVQGELRMFDGETLTGLLCIPRNLRCA